MIGRVSKLMDNVQIHIDCEDVNRLEILPSILEVIAETTGLGLVVVAQVTPETWTACAVLDRVSFGLKTGDNIDLDMTVCQHVCRLDQPVAIEQASTDPVFSKHKGLRTFGIESYVAVPITIINGAQFGTLCAFDPSPSQVGRPHILAMFKLFADMIAKQLDQLQQHKTVADALEREVDTGALRDRFIAILGHDLRNPLSAISACGHVLQRKFKDSDVERIGSRIVTNAARMGVMINDLLDFTRGHIGAGLGVARRWTPELPTLVQAVVGELVDANPDRQMDVAVDIAQPVYCDGSRIQQLASNLLANALAHGDPAVPVTFRAYAANDDFVIEVRNGGAPIDADVMADLFEPFRRQSSDSTGLGLGLSICAQIVREHEGTLSATSTREAGTVFTARIPLAPSGQEAATQH